jgi:regulator of sirC expression with transglutaminase-like and TPR domain
MNRFAQLARTDAPTLDLLALAIADALRDVDQAAALAELDRLAGEVVRNGVGETGLEQIEALQTVLGRREGFIGDVEEYDHPDNSMLDLVLERRRGLPILLSVVWIEVGRRVGIPLRGVGLPGHYVAGWFGDGDPILLDPFKGGMLLADPPPPGRIVQTPVHLTALRILSNLVASYERRGDVGRSLKAAQLRLELPLGDRDLRVMEFEHRRIGARMN